VIANLERNVRFREKNKGFQVHSSELFMGYMIIYSKLKLHCVIFTPI